MEHGTVPIPLKKPATHRRVMLLPAMKLMIPAVTLRMFPIMITFTTDIFFNSCGMTNASGSDTSETSASTDCLEISPTT